MHAALEQGGNPGSTTHWQGLQARALLDDYRKRFAALLAVDPVEIIFTASATEANNLALRGLLYRQQQPGLLTLGSEHSAVLSVAKALQNEGIPVQILPVQTSNTAAGLLDLEVLAGALKTSKTSLVSVMAVNNETGVCQDLGAIYALCHQHGALLHVDAAQALGKLDLASVIQYSDLTTFSGHKCGGPTGVGVLRIRQRPPLRLQHLLDGGGQERGLRPGTEALHQVVGLVTAAEIADKEREMLWTHAEGLQQQLLDSLQGLSGWRRHGANTVPHIVNIGFDDVHGESLILGMPEIAVSSGSACTSHTLEPSHVLLAMGQSAVEAQGAIRLSFALSTQVTDVLLAGQCLHREVNRLRAMAPLVLS